MNATLSAVNLSNMIFRLLPGATCRLPERSGVLLTIDDGPHPSATENMLRKLEQHDLHALFFFTGEAVEAYPELAADVQRSGHEIGTHGFYHRSMFADSSGNIARQLSRSLEASEKATGERPKWFRPPYGRWNPLQNDLLRELELRLLLWNRMPCDFSSNVRAEDIGVFLRRTLRAGDILVLHDNEKSLKKIDYVMDALSSILQERKLRTRNTAALEMETPSA